MKASRILQVVLLLGAAIWLPAFISNELLPSGWADKPSSHWWTMPTVGTMVLFSVSTAVSAVWIVIDDVTS